MKKLISAVLILIAAGAFARVFWLKEFADDHDYPEMFLYVGIMIAAALAFKAVQRGARHTKPHRTQAERPKYSDPLAELHALTGTDARADALPGWQLRLRSPFEPKRTVTSWIGGVPVAPPDFVWPRRGQGDALHFVAQIDLADLKAEPDTGQRPALPDAGAMLIFITERVYSGEAERPSYHVLFLTADEMKHARAIPVPEDLRPLEDLGFWIQTPTFHFSPVDLVPYLDSDQNQAELPQEDGIDWINSWGLAAFEAQAALTAMENERNQRIWREDFEERRDKNIPLKDHQIRQREQDVFLKTSEEPVYGAIKAFLERAEAEDQTAPVDAEILSALVAQRRSLAEGMPTNTMLKIRMTPSPKRIFDDITLMYFDRQRGTLASVPSGFHTFLTNQITARSHHRLFGLAIPAMTDCPDLRGVDCLLTLDSDRLLGTETEHESGFSIWCDRAEMAQGRFKSGRVIWHTNV